MSRQIIEPADLSECTTEFDGEGATIYDARVWTEQAAREKYAHDYGHSTGSVLVRTMYARWLTREEQWDCHGRDAYCEVKRDAYCEEQAERGRPYDRALTREAERRFPWPPLTAPDDYVPDGDDEYLPVWRPCAPHATGAVMVWACCWKEDA